MALTWDLETVPTEAGMSASYPKDSRPHPANYKDAEKIAAWYVADEAKWKAERAKECSLNPRLGRVVCAATHDGNTASIFVAEKEKDEADVLRKLWGGIAAHSGSIITFNGGSFDVPYLLTRSLILGVKPAVSAKTIRDWLRRYSYAPHYDVRSVLTQWDGRMSGTLTDWCQALGIESTDTSKGADVYTQYQAGDFAAIAAHAKSDVEITQQLYERVSTIYGGLDLNKPLNGGTDATE